jgi:Cu+-exporting ATPase
MEETGIAIGDLADDANRLAGRGATPMYVAIDDRISGIIAVADTVRPESREAVAQLNALGLDVWMLTGDNEATARAIAHEVGIDHVLADVLPHQKSEKIGQLQADSKIVAMVGDGINDAPALAQADLGLAIGTGTDVAMAASDITLIGGDLRTIVTAIGLSRRTVATIKQGLFWAFAYNVVLIPVAMGVLYPAWDILLNPVLAAAAMAMSSVSVVTNALRLRTFRAPKNAREILHPSLRSRVIDSGYLVAIGVLALLIGAGALWLSDRAGMGITTSSEHGAMAAEVQMANEGAMDDMDMPASDGTISPAGVGLNIEFSTNPAGVQPGEPAKLTFRIVDQETGEVVTDLPLSHERPMHLIVVSGDLAQFQHIHPQQAADGSYVVETTFPVAGTYLLYNEFVHADQTVLDTHEVVVGTASMIGTELEADTAPPPVDGLTMEVNVPDTIKAGQPVELGLNFMADGEPVTTLEPYLAAAAHVAIVDESGRSFAHTHAEVAVAEADHADEAGGHGGHDTAASFGPDLKVDYTFGHPGTYKLWVQVLYNGEVVTVPFTVEVE